MIPLLLAACATAPPEPEQHHLQGEAFGTTWSVSWRGAGDEARTAAAIEEVLADVDRKMSTWRDDSELAAVRRGPGAVEVSAETAEVVQAALELAARTDGAFDPTVEPLMELWGFREGRPTAAPDAEALEAARSQVGWSRVRVLADPPRIDAGGTALDLSAIAKGHAVDRVSAALTELELADHLVEIGGEVRARGSGPAGPWRLGIDTPSAGVAPGTSLQAVIALGDAALATSGNYRNRYELAGVEVVHILDPRTGRPRVGAPASVSIVAPDCRSADGLATAVMVLGPQTGLELVEQLPGVEALVLVARGDGFAQTLSTGMAAHLQP